MHAEFYRLGGMARSSCSLFHLRGDGMHTPEGRFSLTGVRERETAGENESERDGLRPNRIVRLTK
jgi:hypothetical protein